MSSNLDFSPEALLDLSSFDPRDPRYPFAANTMVRAAWPMPLDMSAQPPNERQSTSPSAENARQYSQTAHPNPSPTLLTNWPMQQPQNQQQQQQQQQQHPQQHQQQQQPQQLPQYLPENALMGPQYTFGNNFQTSPLDYHMPTTQAAFEAGLQMEAPFNGLAQSVEQAAMWANWQEIENAMMIAGANDGLPRAGRQSLGSNSPTGTYLEVLSLPSSGSDNGWSTVDHYNSMESYQAQNAAIFNPGQTLHLRTHSDSSQSDGTGHTIESFGSFEDISNPYSPYSPGSDTYLDLGHRNCFHGEHTHPHENISPAAAVAPVPIKISSSTRTSPAVTSSPPSARRNSAPRKSPTTKATKPVIRRTSNGKKDTEKRVGRRRGPLLPEQRKQASEIRKLRACLRCKFLKKTCDKGEPCAGCQPSHARLWQVPCTRIDIKDIGYFMKDWRADYERHVGRGVTVYNIKGFAQKEELLWITHGYGFALPLMSREVYVTDDSCFSVDWVEATEGTDENYEFDYRTAKISAGAEGVPTEVLSEYLDKHLDGPFEDFVDDHFEGTPFITDIFKTAHRYYVKEKVQVVRKALKLVLAYNLTQHITMVEQRGDEHPMEGLIDDEDCRFAGKIVAPVMINFQIKCALADMWRELQKEILEELSSLYSSVYSGDRLKNWPTIFMIASILLAVWEEMQFDCHYRVPDAAAVNKFCTDMETTPVGVIVGLFHAISQKLPAFTEWETRRHGQLLNNNVAVCEAMTEMRQHVTKHESYLKTRPEAKFDRSDFDCLSNKFLSKLVIRAN